MGRTGYSVSISQTEKGITPKTFGRWVTSCVNEAYEDKSDGRSIAHATRGLASTKAFIEGGFSLQQVMNSADWKTNTVFERFYKNPDLTPALLGPSAKSITVKLSGVHFAGRNF